VDGLPAGAVWTPDASELGVGTIFWSASQSGSYEPIIEVRDVDGILVAEQRIELFIYPQLTASVPVAAFEADVGQELTIVPSVSGLIDEGDVRWGVTPSDLPAWLSFDELSGTIEVDTGSANSVFGLVLTAVDQNDFATDNTDAFSVSILEAGPDITPDPFTIAPATNVEPRWEVTSAAITPLGYEAPTTVVVSGAAQVSVEGGDWGSTAAISPGQSFLLKTVAPDQGQTLTADVKVGPGAPATWSVTSWSETVRTISASTTSANPQTLFGASWTSPTTRKRLVINPQVTVSSTASTVPALTMNSALQGGLIIENRGVISGVGGDGGIAGSTTGKNGGDALLLQSNGVKVINTGVIAGGGGGGGLGGKGANGKRTVVTRNRVRRDVDSHRPSVPFGLDHGRTDLNSCGPGRFHRGILSNPALVASPLALMTVEVAAEALAFDELTTIVLTMKRALTQMFATASAERLRIFAKSLRHQIRIRGRGTCGLPLWPDDHPRAGISFDEHCAGIFKNGLNPSQRRRMR